MLSNFTQDSYFPHSGSFFLETFEKTFGWIFKNTAFGLNLSGVQPSSQVSSSTITLKFLKALQQSILTAGAGLLYNLRVKTLFFSLLFCCVLLTCTVSSAAVGPSYLLLSHDPDFLKEIAKISEVTYSSGRIRLIKLSIPFPDLPVEMAARLRKVSSDEIFNGPAARGGAKAADPAVLALLSKVDGARLMGYADAITITGKRSTAQLDASAASGNRRAMDYIAAAFKDLGYEIERQCYKDRKADKECNIVARRRSWQSDAKTILVIGHMDSVGYENAGADDNASGAAGVLEIANVLSGYKSDHDLIFVTANGEENDMSGSYACVKKMKETGELSRVAWAINMDMISWNKDGIIEIETNKEFSAHADWVASMARRYTKLDPYITMPAWGSDHVPFLEAGRTSPRLLDHC
jgi:hypothetical protein